MRRTEETNGLRRTMHVLMIILSTLMVPVQCFTTNNYQRCLTKGIRSSLSMKFPSWFFRKDPPKVLIDYYSEEKKSLLRAIAATRIRKTSSSLESSGEGTMTDRQSILSCVSILETMYANRRHRQSLSSGTSVADAMTVISPNQCADGLWSLIYSTKESSTKIPSLFASSSSSFLSTWIDKISSELYKVFFRFAPLLAGGQDESTNQRPIQTVSTEQTTTGSSSSVSNQQLIDVANRKVTNVVTFENAFLTKLFGPRQIPNKEIDSSKSSSSSSSGGSAKIEIRV